MADPKETTKELKSESEKDQTGGNSDSSPNQRKLDEETKNEHSGGSEDGLSCRICGKGGSELCCENCPSFFHLECVGFKSPPLRWKCENCRRSHKRGSSHAATPVSKPRRTAAGGRHHHKLKEEPLDLSNDEKSTSDDQKKSTTQSKLKLESTTTTTIEEHQDEDDDEEAKTSQDKETTEQTADLSPTESRGAGSISAKDDGGNGTDVVTKNEKSTKEDAKPKKRGRGRPRVKGDNMLIYENMQNQLLQQQRSERERKKRKYSEESDFVSPMYRNKRILVGEHHQVSNISPMFLDYHNRTGGESYRFELKSALTWNPNALDKDIVEEYISTSKIIWSRCIGRKFQEDVALYVLHIHDYNILHSLLAISKGFLPVTLEPEKRQQRENSSIEGERE